MTSGRAAAALVVRAPLARTGLSEKMARRTIGNEVNATVRIRS